MKKIHKNCTEGHTIYKNVIKQKNIIRRFKKKILEKIIYTYLNTRLCKT